MTVRFSLSSFLLAGLRLSSAFASSVSITENDDIASLFLQWQQIHNRTYSSSVGSSSSEQDHRLAIFRANYHHVQQHNDAFDAGRTTFRMTIARSPFADLTDAEFRDQYLMESQNCSATTTQNQRLRPLSDKSKQTNIAIDWRTRGIVTPIKNQGNCGSCWTFSTTGCLEAHLCLAHEKDCTHWTGLAEQQLVDCAGAYNNFGCDGGLPSQAFEYIKYTGGIDFEDTYAYQAKATGACQYSSRLVGGQVAEVFNITRYDEDDLVYAIANVGPVSIAYQVSPDFRFYAHGVYDAYNATSDTVMCQNAPEDVNHAVVAVGLGTTTSKDTDNDDGVPYYIVRNSWGTEWGMEGYFWMKRGMNLCGVSDCASFPLVPHSAALEQYGKQQPQQGRGVEKQ